MVPFRFTKILYFWQKAIAKKRRSLQLQILKSILIAIIVVILKPESDLIFYIKIYSTHTLIGTTDKIADTFFMGKTEHVSLGRSSHGAE